jgi:hypothetical protein
MGVVGSLVAASEDEVDEEVELLFLELELERLLARPHLEGGCCANSSTGCASGVLSSGVVACPGRIR